MDFWKNGEKNDVVILSSLSGNLPVNRILNQFKAIVRYQADHDLFWGELEISGFRKKIFIPENGLVFFTYKMGVRHRGIDSGPTYGIEYPIGLGSRPMFRTATTEAGLTGSFTYYNQGLSAGQLMDYTHRKYTMGCVRVPMAVLANKWYEFTLSGGSHTNAGNRDGQDGSAELNPTNINYLLIEYEAGKTIS